MAKWIYFLNNCFVYFIFINFTFIVNINWFCEVIFYLGKYLNEWIFFFQNNRILKLIRLFWIGNNAVMTLLIRHLRMIRMHRNIFIIQNSIFIAFVDEMRSILIFKFICIIFNLILLKIIIVEQVRIGLHFVHTFIKLRNILLLILKNNRLFDRWT